MTSRSKSWQSIPPDLRPIVRARINSEQEADRIKALENCQTYGLDYDTERAKILQEMIADGRALMERQTRGESRAERWKAPDAARVG